MSNPGDTVREFDRNQLKEKATKALKMAHEVTRDFMGNIDATYDPSLLTGLMAQVIFKDLK